MTFLPHLPAANDLEIANAKAGANNRKMRWSNKKNSLVLPLNLSLLTKKSLSKTLSPNLGMTKKIITKVRPLGRSYEVLMDSGKMFLRNRTLLRPITINNILIDPTPSLTANPSQQLSLPVRRSKRLLRQTINADVKPSASQGGIVRISVSCVYIQC